MPDDAERGQGGSAHSGLFAELPGGGRARRFSAGDLSSRELPEATQEPGARPLLHEPPVPLLEHDKGGPYVGFRRLRRPDGEDRGVGELLGGPAPEPDRARRAGGSRRPARRFSELHQGFVELARSVPGQQGLEDLRESPPDAGGGEVALVPGPSSRHAQPVRLQGDHGSAGQEARKGPRRVRAHARKLLPPRHGRREPPAAVLEDTTGRLPEMASPCVVSGPLPGLQHVVLGGPRERVDGREPVDEPFEVRRGLVDPGLLEQDLGDPDPVGVPVRAPGERTSVRTEPVEQRSGDRGGDRRLGRGRAEGPHSSSREEPRD